VSLWKRGNVFWTYVYVKGKRHCRSTGTGNRRQAEIKDLEFKKELEEKARRPAELNPDMKFAQLVSVFLVDGGARPYHKERFKNLLPFFGEFPLFKIDRGLVHKYILARQSERRKIKDATINRDVSVLRHTLYWAMDQSFIERNPLARIKMLRERRTKRPVLTLAEEELLLPACQGHTREMVIAALDTGMRRGEVLNQLWEDVDLERKLLYVTRSKTPEGEAREIPLTQRMYNMLVVRRQPSGLVFTYQDRNIFSIKRTWRTTLARAKIRHIRFHDLRHTFNTRLMEAGVMQEIRKALMGHSSGGEINSIYTHIELPTKRRAIQMLEAWCQQHRITQTESEVTHATSEQTLSAGTLDVLPETTEFSEGSD
jgi:integrase